MPVLIIEFSPFRMKSAPLNACFNLLFHALSEFRSFSKSASHFCQFIRLFMSFCVELAFPCSLLFPSATWVFTFRTTNCFPVLLILSFLAIHFPLSIRPRLGLVRRTMYLTFVPPLCYSQIVGKNCQRQDCFFACLSLYRRLHIVSCLSDILLFVARQCHIQQPNAFLGSIDSHRANPIFCEPFSSFHRTSLQCVLFPPILILPILFDMAILPLLFLSHSCHYVALLVAGGC